MSALEKFQELLHELFQFEASDLDFGIYRILNFKREQIDKFIKEDITKQIENAFARHKDERLKDISDKFEEAKRKVSETLGANAFTPTGELKPEFENTPVGKDYLQVKEQRDSAQKIDEIKLQVFNDLYSFFSRYYEEGDFIPQYRYSIKSHKYAIPYNGEEVKLYWTNADQYYTKTGILFRDYTFYTDHSKAYKIIFRTVSASEELGSNKATKARFFVLDDEKPITPLHPPLTKGGQRGVIIRFQYRELTEKEVKSYGVEGGSNTAKQEKINQKILDEILKQIKDATLKGFLSNPHKPNFSISNPPIPSLAKGSKGGFVEKSLLLYQLSRFTAKNTKDYFIHKNLKRFLSEQLDYFIKADVLSIETLENEPFLDKHITRAKVVREIGEKIIDFLAQIEDFQKRLWEKKKFVLKTDYVITTDRIFSLCHSDPDPERSEGEGEESLDYFYDEILKNKEQLKEWTELGFEIATPSAHNDKKKEARNDKKKGVIARSKATKQSLKNLHLPIDTRYFSQEFKERLLEKLTNACHPELDSGSHEMPKQVRHDKGNDLDDLLDGILIKSENFQALNLLLGKYKGEVQTIYIDPPFNLGTNADFLYNVNYKDSTWISILENRLLLARNLLSDKGSIFARCDYNGNMYVRMLMNEVFGEGNFRNEIAVRKVNYQGTNVPQRFNPAYDMLFFFSKVLNNNLFNVVFKERGRESKWINAVSPKENREQNTIFIKERKFIAPKDHHWRFSQQKFNTLIENGRIKIKEDYEYIDVFGNKQKGVPQYLESDFMPLDSDWTDISGYAFTAGFSTENSEILLKRVIESTSNPSIPPLVKGGEGGFSKGGLKGDLILDFFLGSGTTTAVAHKTGRKWIGVEMGEHFWTVVLPRMKKVLAYDKSGISKEVKDYKGGGFFKYHVLEQYEDALDNIELSPKEKAPELFGDDYLLKYFLELETQESPYLMNIEHLKDPFSYKLKVNPEEVGEPVEMAVDIPETFNYLLGLKVKRVKVRFFANAQNDKSPHPPFTKGGRGGIKYLFILGEKDGINTAVVWRNYDDRWGEEDFKKDKEFIIREIKGWMPRVVYVNGQSALTTNFDSNTVEIRYIEPEFKTLMFT